MAQETVTEYETVEKQKTRTLCDNCNRTEEEEDILTVAINPQERQKHSQNLELIKTFEERDNAELFIDGQKKAQAYDEIVRGIDKKELYGVGWNHNTKTVNMNASATADLCASCVFDLFNIEIPEDEEVEDINLGETEVNIDTTKEVTTVWPQIKFPKFTTNRSQMGWMGKIGLWPLVLFISSHESFVPGAVRTGEEERQKGYIAGSIGSILWTGVILTVLYLASFIVLAV